MTILRIALAQINLVVGDLQGNETKIVGTIKQAREQGAAIVAFPELAVTGYPPEDLLLKPGFVDANLATIQRIADAATGITAIVGYVDRDDDPYNAAGVLHNGALAAVYHKRYLPN
jgi:NAD+ synthase (glutamine-hydrolysing)